MNEDKENLPAPGAKVCAALVAAQKQFGPALKASINPHFKSRYADLSACVEAVIDALNANGIALVQRTTDCETGVCVETVFVHESGEMLACGALRVPAPKQDPQGYGSALTYARRYSLMAACGIAPEDDDGNAASKPNGAPAKLTPVPEATPAQGRPAPSEPLQHVLMRIGEVLEQFSPDIRDSLVRDASSFTNKDGKLLAINGVADLARSSEKRLKWLQATLGKLEDMADERRDGAVPLGDNADQPLEPEIGFPPGR